MTLTQDQITRLSTVIPAHTPRKQYVEYLDEIARSMVEYLERHEWRAIFSAEYNAGNGFWGSDVHLVAKELCDERRDPETGRCQWRLRLQHNSKKVEI